MTKRNELYKCDICGKWFDAKKKFHLKLGDESYLDFRCLDCCKKMYPGFFKNQSVIFYFADRSIWAYLLRLLSPL